MSRFGPRFSQKRGFFPDNRAGDRARRALERRTLTKTKKEKKSDSRKSQSRFGNMSAEVIPNDTALAMVEALSLN